VSSGHGEHRGQVKDDLTCCWPGLASPLLWRSAWDHITTSTTSRLTTSRLSRLSRLAFEKGYMDIWLQSIQWLYLYVGTRCTRYWRWR